MSIKKSSILLMMAFGVLTLIAAQCGAAQPTPETITVIETVVVEKEVAGETITVIETVEVVKTVEVEKVVEVEVPVAMEDEIMTDFTSADPNTLVYVNIGGPDTFDPQWNYENAGGDILQNVYETLVFYNREKAAEFVPQLATGWAIDDNVYTFNIRDGVQFHNGDPMTPEDVAYSFQRGILQGGTWSPQWLLAEPFFGVGYSDIAELVDPTGEMVDDPELLQAADPELLLAACQQVVDAIVADNEAGTVTITLAQSWGPFLPTIAQPWASVIDKSWAIENGTWDGDCATWQNYYGVTSETTPLREVTNGTGAYMVEEWIPNEQVVLLRNDNYWRNYETGPAWDGGPVGNAAIERIVKKTVNEWGTRFAMAQAGDADFIYVPRQYVTQIDPLVGERCDYNAQTGGFDCALTDNPNGPLRLRIGYPNTNRTDAFFNFDINDDGGNPFIGSGRLDGNGIPVDFFSDIHMRKAFNYCFDWDVYIQDALAGEAIQNIGVINPDMPGYDPNGPHYSYDEEKCIEELQQAWDGEVWEKGFRFQIGYNTGNDTRQTIAEIIQSNFAAIDSKFQVEIIGLPWASLLSQVRDRRMAMFVAGWGEDIHDPHNWVQPFTVGTYAVRQNMPDELKSQFKAYVDAGVAEPDPAKRHEIYLQLNQLDYEQVPGIRLAVPTGRRYEQRWVDGSFINTIMSDRYYYPNAKQ